MRLAQDVAELGTIEQQPLLDGRNMTMVLGPTKAAGGGRDAKAEDKQRGEEAVPGDGSGEAPAPARDEEPQPREEVAQAEAKLSSG
jgi:translation initiation factor IF-3